MAPERIFQGRQRGILELAEGKSHLYLQSRQSSHGDLVFGEIYLQQLFTCPVRETHTPKHRSSVLPPAPVGRRIVFSPPQKREQPGLDRHPGSILERVQSPLPDPGRGSSTPTPISRKSRADRGVGVPLGSVPASLTYCPECRVPCLPLRPAAAGARRPGSA